MRVLTIAQKAYIAGFLDGDGSIYVQLKPNRTYRFRYQIAPAVVFFQAKKELKQMQLLQRLITAGYIRIRNDGIVEYIIGDTKSMAELLTAVLPYLRFKKKQAQIFLKILRRKQLVKSAADFVKLATLVDRFQILNYSKRRIQTSASVQQTLRQEGLLTP